MGNQKFKLSDMIPNAWFFKLKDMTTTTKPPAKLPTKLKNRRLPPPPPSSPPSSEPPQSQPRKSYHFARDLADLQVAPQDPPHPLSPPRSSRSKKHPTTRKNLPTKHHHHRQEFSLSSVSTTCTCRTSTTTTASTTTDEFPSPSQKAERFDIVIDVSKSYGFDFELPRIVTKPNEPTKVTPRVSHSPPSRRCSVSSPGGVRLKINSPRIMARKQGQNGNTIGGRRSVSSLSWRKRRSISESFAVVKSSRDPQRDFRESMVEMIVQNNLKASKDLEDLLACYLSLNSDEYHDVIIDVFKQIWFDFIHLRQPNIHS